MQAMATVAFEFIESCGQTPELFEMSEGAFDAVALTIYGSVAAELLLAHRAWRDDCLYSALGEMVQDRICVVALVGEHRLRASVSKKRDGMGTVVSMAAGQHEAEWQVKLAGQQVDLGRQTSSTPPREVSAAPFFVPSQLADGPEQRWSRSSRTGSPGSSEDRRRPDPTRRSRPIV